eukprot:Skav235153  [mRNA]  locus=scaffold1923:90288:91154:- [translate_table: standard]
MDRSAIRFEAPDVRDRSTKHIVNTFPVDSEYPKCWSYEAGVNYIGVCPKADCVSQKKGFTTSQTGFGRFRPNEQRCRKEIVCHACGSCFLPYCYLFRNCSANIEFCIVNESPDKISLSEDRKDKARQLGRRGKTALYEMLIMDVARPGKFPDVDCLDTDTESECAEGEKESDSDSEWEECSHVSPDMSPEEIYFTHNSIANRFRCGRSIHQTVQRLKQGEISADDFPAITVFERDGKWHCLDNRRLWCFKEAGLSSVPVRRIDASRAAKRKFTTTNGGESVVVRSNST